MGIFPILSGGEHKKMLETTTYFKDRLTFHQIRLRESPKRPSRSKLPHCSIRKRSGALGLRNQRGWGVKRSVKIQNVHICPENPKIISKRMNFFTRIKSLLFYVPAFLYKYGIWIMQTNWGTIISFVLVFDLPGLVTKKGGGFNWNPRDGMILQGSVDKELWADLPTQELPLAGCPVGR